MFNNYRSEISRKVDKLGAIYSKIDKFFHQNFSLQGTKYGIVSGNYYYEAKSYAVNIIMDWSKDFEDTLSEIKILQSKHKGSFFDGETSIAQDNRNNSKTRILSERYEKVMNLVRNSRILD